MISKDMIGSSYTNEELISFLYIENQYYKNNHFAKKITPTTITPISLEDIRTNPEYDVARHYISKDSKRRARHLVIANEYPKKGAEYGNGFVHKRVKFYEQEHTAVDVVAFGKRLPKMVYEYDGVRVLSGYVYELLALLSSKDYDSISVHFLNHEMWNVIQPFLKNTRLYVYIHGYESNRWIRRVFDYTSADQLDANIERTLHLQSFWKHVVENNSSPDKFIFVSKWWQDAVTEDMEVTFPTSKTEIIHNLIDTQLFRYVKKSSDQRFNILWIRTADALKYGHDLAIECLKLVRESHYWPRVNVKIIGDGKHFQDFEDEFSSDSNVSIERRFVPQSEIAKIHKDYGLFLVPTRLDSQGVSRDEAMCSGLVPITNSVTAIPEFVDDTCALLAPSENSSVMAEKIIDLLGNPQKFQLMSEAAAQRAASQCGPSSTVMKELKLMTHGGEVI